MDIRKRRDAPLNRLLETFDCIGLREVYHRPDVCQQVFSPMFGLACEDRNLCLAPLALGDITGNR
jgi:hypothetical protein